MCSHSFATPSPSLLEELLLQKEPFIGRFGSTGLQFPGRALATVIDPGAHSTCTELESWASCDALSSLSRPILFQKAALVSSECSFRNTTSSVFPIVASSSWTSMWAIGMSKG